VNPIVRASSAASVVLPVPLSPEQAITAGPSAAQA
jgi:hypothetical protein